MSYSKIEEMREKEENLYFAIRDIEDNIKKIKEAVSIIGVRIGRKEIQKRLNLIKKRAEYTAENWEK